MANRSKRKGTAFESAVVEYLRTHGWRYAERRALSGALDKGDVTGTPGLVFECKAEKQFDLAGAVGEAMAEKSNADADFAAAILKRPRRKVDEAYAVMPLWLYVRLLHAAGYLG